MSSGHNRTKGHCSCELTAAVFAYTRSVEDQARQHSSTKEIEFTSAHLQLRSCGQLLATGYQGKKIGRDRQKSGESGQSWKK